jgi:hypothetical protein
MDGPEKTPPALPRYPQGGHGSLSVAPPAAQDVPVHIGRLLRQAREARELSQDDLAALSGVRQSAISE